MDKSFLTNLLALLVTIAGLLMTGSYAELVLNTGLFALSGGLTNWLAVHMLFEKVPGFYGSGVIPARFEEFKHGIKILIMEQFFSEANIENFFSRLDPEKDGGEAMHSGIKKLIDSVDMSDAFESLVEVIMSSSFGGMLSMMGGKDALDPLKEPFVRKMQDFLSGVVADKDVLNSFKDNIKQSSTETLLNKVESIVNARLEELTPQLVKEIIQQMIKKHLGWLVVWGGVLGGIIGLTVTILL